VNGDGRLDREGRAGPDDRTSDLEYALAQDPNNPDLLLEASRYYHRMAMQGDDAAFEKADTSIKTLLRLDERNAEGLSISGSLLTIKARRSGSIFKRFFYSFKAARKLDRAVKMDPSNLSARTIRAFTALVLPGFLRRLKTAIEDFEYLIELKRENPAALPDEMMPKVLYNLGLAYAKSGDKARAHEILSAVVADFPGTREHNRAEILLKDL
jgi:tetratricopeptide (TPR) repeat protein